VIRWAAILGRLWLGAERILATRGGSGNEGGDVAKAGAARALPRERPSVGGMANESTTFVLGIPIPSASPIFLAIVGVDAVFGLAAVITGAVTMLSKKGRGRHSNLGTIYFRWLLGLFVTMSALSLMRWAENYHLFILGALFVCVCVFRAHRCPPGLAATAETTGNGRVLHFDPYRALRG
jgi:hypothetical protein